MPSQSPAPDHPTAPLSEAVTTATALLTIDVGAIVANWQSLATRHAAPTGAVVKADGYGLGARQIVPALYADGCRHFFVAHLSEAMAIRDLIPNAMLAVLNGLLPGAEAAHAAHNILPVLGSLDELARWSAQADRQDRRLPALLHVDTGMARLGLDPAEWATLTSHPELRQKIDLRYLMTHLATAELPSHPLTALQRTRFLAAAAALPQTPISIANSSAIFLGAAYRSNLARPGAALYGINPTPGLPNPQRPVLTLKTRVLQLRGIQPGDPVGYDATWRAQKPTRIATACVGYADGWPRILSNRGQAFFDGQPLPLVGRVSMDLVTYDATACPALRPGDWLELIGPHAPIDEIAREAQTTGYEILTSLGSRYTRVFAPL